ncbi:hypothetical protein GCM10020258_45270 [Sphingomonas yabuuchiae]
MTRNPVGKLLLFGATGDLSQRMLLPSLFNLHSDGLLPEGLTITGTARSDHDDASFREFAAKALDTFLPDDRKDADKIASFLERVQYQSLDASSTDGFPALAEKVGDVSNGLAIYLSTAPSLFESTIKGLESVGLAGETVRIGLEKPLGYDLASSKEINDAVAFGFPEERTFRIDHYLGKETVQNILALRFGNFFFEPIWNAHGIDNVQITIAETVGLEDRAGYYEGAGALRDMVQNHILQLLALVAMEPPARYDGTAIRDEKAKVFRSLRLMTPEEVPNNTVTGQYADGAVGVRSSVPMPTSWASRPRPRPSSRSRRMSTIGAGRGSLLPAHRQAHGRAPFRDRDPVQARTALDVRRAWRPAPAQHAGHPPAARGIYPAAGDGEGAGPRPRRHPPARSAAEPVARRRVCGHPPPHRL